ncbi:MAG: hypothetical protein MMC33_002369 [Icmadophila ericetorum]|nr:hypothetical protein [Icmadophila ericetorum]
MSLPSLIVFGPQTSLPPIEYLSQLRLVLLNDHRLVKLLAAIRDLPNLWTILVASDPDLNQVPGLQALQDIDNWIDSGKFPTQASEQLLPNVLLTPLIVITHIVEYFSYLKRFETSVSHSQIIKSTQNGGIQGFCIGLLAAIALACSQNEEEVGALGAIALRLSVCIGAYVDLGGQFANAPCETLCLTVRWSQAEVKDQISNILQQYPGAYISALTDTTSATITIPRLATRSASRQLSELDVIVKPIGLNGRFHSSANGSAIESLIKLCQSNPNLQFPPIKPQVPLRSNTQGNIISGGHLQESALRSILVEVSNWCLTMEKSVSEFKQDVYHQVIVCGMIDCIPRSISKGLNLQVLHLYGLNKDSNIFDSVPNGAPYSYPDHAIAIIGMGCRFPGANSVAEFWEVIRSGASMLGELPSQRFSTRGLRRSPDTGGRFLGNFISDAEAFDHRFFKKSSREAASMDPQHRLALQVAYETLESAGYFSSKSPTDIGCYIGVAASDYEDNVASHLPTAFSVTGAVRAFASGKISHFFGWSGPSIVFDTACSSSAVAIHTACKAIQTGECSMALAGGVNVITSPTLHQNLAAANFLSPTGASKSFDAKADGYCRGEGAGLVLLKKLSDVSVNDNILGVLVGSALNQNSNSAPIVVPASSSQSSLYRRVLSLASMEPAGVSFVEAHGPGTPKGDPIECQSIRQVFGDRSRRLYFGSVKGNIGHTEAASGVAGLIKVLLMMQHRSIPKQANFTTLNPNIAPLEPSNMVIPRSTRSWNVDFMAACINNYGAAGSNAAMIVTQSPRIPSVTSTSISLPKYPIMISAHSSASIQESCMALKCFLEKNSELTEDHLLASIAFNLAHKQNRSLGCFTATAATSLEQLREYFSLAVTEPTPKAKPVVLVFAGQTGNSVAFSEVAFHGSLLLQHHLRRCNDVIQSMGLKSLFPDIFRSEPVEDVIDLHCMLFSLQYSCALSWIDSGLNVETIIGHSFGQLTGLCVAGSLSLEDGMKLIAGRASLIKSRWGLEIGAMLLVEGDIQKITSLIAVSDYKVEIACYNGPSSYVLVGTKVSIKGVEEIFERQSSLSVPLKVKRLQTTHGFHSEFADAIMPDYTRLVKELTFRKPNIPLETCSKENSWTVIRPDLVAQQSREPVYFGEAVSRIEGRLGSCTWIEAGSATGATHMVRRALQTSKYSHSYHPVNLGALDSMGLLADTTINLWKAGIHVQFWPFHHVQRDHYSYLNMPPYQFEKSRHWLSYIDRHETTRPRESNSNLVSLIGFSDSLQRVAEFSVNQADSLYTSCLQGHAVLGNPLCPASLYIEIMLQAATSLEPGLSTCTPSFEDLRIDAPLGMDPSREVRVALTKISGPVSVWSFALSSYFPHKVRTATRHAVGRITFIGLSDTKLAADFARRERFVDSLYCEALLADNEAEALQGSFVYKTFEKVVHYGSIFRGVKRISMKEHEVAGQVVMPNSSSGHKSLCNPLAIDNFTQVAGLHVNSLEECNANEVFVCTKIGHLQASRTFGQSHGPWLVYSSFEHKNEKQMVNEILVFDTTRKKLVMTILDVQFNKVAINSLRKALIRANSNQRLLDHGTNTSIVSEDIAGRKERGSAHSASLRDTKESPTGVAVRTLLSEVADIPKENIRDSTLLEDIGIDSLMATEVLSEIKKRFGIVISTVDFANIPTCKSLCQCIETKHCISPLSSSEGDSVLDLSDRPTLDTPGTPGSLAGGEEMLDDEQLKLWRLVAGHLDITGIMSRGVNLASVGFDSLLGIELENDIEKAFGVKIDTAQLNQTATFGDLSDMILVPHGIFHFASASEFVTPPEFRDGKSRKESQTNRSNQFTKDPKSEINPYCLVHAAGDFASIRKDFSRFAEQTVFSDFRTKVYPRQAQLVLAYTAEAFRVLGCPLDSLDAGHELPHVPCIPRHKKVLSQFHKILQEAGLITINNNVSIRTAKSLNGISSEKIYDEILTDFPQHACEHRLLNSTGSKLAEIVSGKIDPIQVLFGTKSDRDLLEEVYTESPMFATGSKMLGNFLCLATSKLNGSEKLQILEIGAGTGGTTKHLVKLLLSKGVNFTYMFTDLSSSMVAAAKRKFAQYHCMEYMVLDVEKEPPEKLLGSYHIILSSNCIHATRSILHSSINLRSMLRADGFLCLLELTRNLFWLDCVFGMLEGWWLFEDGRKHILADEFRWQRTLLGAGFKHVDWTDDETEESDQFRLIAAFMSNPQISEPLDRKLEKTVMETVEFHKVQELSLYADIYYPTEIENTRKKRPIALMIHGGGHIMLSRKDIRSKQTSLLLEHGLLPVSVDYRLCPEVALAEGPIPDVCTALQWARQMLPALKLQRPDIRPDGDKVVVVGWSTGGTLALTLAWTAPQIGLKPPDAILAFYCPTDYESDFWKQPNVPVGTEPHVDESYDLLEGVHEKPITGYNIPPSKRALGGWLSNSDPRSRIALHMNWKGQTLPIILGGLSNKSELNSNGSGSNRWLSLPQPDPAAIASVSPYSQVVRGNYRVPTFVIHGTKDDLIPWRQTQRFWEALHDQGVPAGMAIIEGGLHLFDLHYDADGKYSEATRQGYEFLFSYVK